MTADEDAALRRIESDQWLPAGSLAFYTPLRACHGCDYCRWPATGPAPRPGKDLFNVTLKIRARQRRVT
jgi:hypothetical protein